MMRRPQRSPIVDRAMQGFSVSPISIPTHGGPTALERARLRRDGAAQGSPDWDAASEAVLELEAVDALLSDGQPRRRLFLLPSSVR
jgi:hypothetical protein